MDRLGLPTCSKCTVPYVHGHGTDETYQPRSTSISPRPQPACGDPKPHRSHNGMASEGPPWCTGVDEPAPGEENVAPMYPRKVVSWSAAGAGETINASAVFFVGGTHEEPQVPEWFCTDSARGEGWGSRGPCPYCDAYMFDGTESVTEDAMHEHFRVCPVVGEDPEPESQIPSLGGFDAALYAAFVAGVKARHVAGVEMRQMTSAEAFHRWRAQWHGEWEER